MGDHEVVGVSGILDVLVSLETPQPSITKISIEITYMKCYSKIPGTNELTIIKAGNAHVP